MCSDEVLINTPRQRGERSGKISNRFSGFTVFAAQEPGGQTAKTVRLLRGLSFTPLKRVVNERISHTRTLHVFPNAEGLKPGSAGFQPAVLQVFNLRVVASYRLPADWKSAVRQAESLRYEEAMSPARTRRRSL